MKTPVYIKRIRNLLMTLSGDNYLVINHCEKPTQNKFLAIGALVLSILLCCFIGSFYSFTKIFNSIFIGLLLSIFFLFTFTNLYLLLLFTLSKDTLPHIKSTGAFAISRGIRIVFICFMSLIISKPIETFLYSGIIDRELEQFKQQEVEKFERSTKVQLASDIRRVNSIYGLTEIKSRLIDSLCKSQVQKVLIVRNLIENSKYYVQRIVILNTKHPSCWIFTFTVMLIFLGPVYFKYLLLDSEYYSKKSELEIRLINIHYYAFKKQYSRYVYLQTGTIREYSEPYEDAPFNTIRKRDTREFKDEKLLVKDLYGI